MPLVRASGDGFFIFLILISVAENGATTLLYDTYVITFFIVCIFGHHCVSGKAVLQINNIGLERK